MEWSEPVFLRYDFEAGPERAAAFVRLGFPRHADETIWTCAFQFQGAACGDELKDGHICRVTGYHGLGALIAASNVIRSWLGHLMDRQSTTTPFEFVFPQFLPTSWHGLYSWATEIVEFEIAQRATSSKEPSLPPHQTVSRSLDGPTLLHQKFKLAGRQMMTIRLAFPTYVQERSAWSCAVQLGGPHHSPVRRMFGANGLLAVANAVDFVRTSLGEIENVLEGNVRELTFPAHVPTEYGLELHRHLCDRIDAEIKQIDQEEDDDAEVRAEKFNEILARLPRSARL